MCITNSFQDNLQDTRQQQGDATNKNTENEINFCNWKT